VLVKLKGVCLHTQIVVYFQLALLDIQQSIWQVCPLFWKRWWLQIRWRSCLPGKIHHIGGSSGILGHIPEPSRSLQAEATGRSCRQNLQAEAPGRSFRQELQAELQARAPGSTAGRSSRQPLQVGAPGRSSRQNCRQKLQARAPGRTADKSSRQELQA
jgi:hypothetical protein